MCGVSDELVHVTAQRATQGLGLGGAGAGFARCTGRASDGLASVEVDILCFASTGSGIVVTDELEAAGAAATAAAGALSAVVVGAVEVETGGDGIGEICGRTAYDGVVGGRVTGLLSIDDGPAGATIGQCDRCC